MCICTPEKRTPLCPSCPGYYEPRYKMGEQEKKTWAEIHSDPFSLYERDRITAFYHRWAPQHWDAARSQFRTDLEKLIFSILDDRKSEAHDT